MPEKIYTVTQAAEKLGKSTKTIHRHIRLGYFEKLVVVPHEKRNDYLFSESCLRLYQRRYDKHLEEEKREYHRRVVKGKHGRGKRGEGR